MEKVSSVILFDTCDVDNGGCDEDKVCKPEPVSCISPDLPCKNAIQCIGIIVDMEDSSHTQSL